MKFTCKCKCGLPFIPDNRHCDQGNGIEDCKPSDNLEYLEFVIEKRERLEKLKRSSNETPR